MKKTKKKITLTIDALLYNHKPYYQDEFEEAHEIDIVLTNDKIDYKGLINILFEGFDTRLKKAGIKARIKAN